MAVFAGMLDAMDFHIGRLIAYLKEQGLYDNTIFIVTAIMAQVAIQVNMKHATS